MVRRTLGLAVGLALLNGRDAAWAACDPAAASNVMATCTGTTTNAPYGYGTGTVTNLTVTVVPGATVMGTLSGLDFSTATVSNSGTVSGGVYGIFANTMATVTNSGTVSGGSDGVYGASAMVTNSGTVSGGALGIIGANVTVINSGTVSGGFGGIVASTATVTNSGTISGGTYGVLGFTTATVTNSGTVSGGVYGISAYTTATVTNSGIVSGGALGINATIAVVTNSGTISGSNVGILTNNAATVTNSGTIIGNVGIWPAAFGSGVANVTNSGTIIGTGGTALQFSGAADTLTLLPGSRIIGAINMGGGADVVNFTAGRDTSWLVKLNNFTGTITGSGAAPFVISGNQIATLDPTPFALADKTLMDFTRGISSILGSLGGTSAAPNGPLSSAFAASDPGSIAARVDDAFAGISSIPALAYAGDAMVFKNPTAVAADGRAVWARGFGGEHIQDAGGVLLRATTTFLGGAVGFDMVAQPDLRLGLFAGGGQSLLSLDQNAGNTKTDTGFGGVYGRWAFTSFGAPSFLDFALHGGGSSNATSRTVANNLAAGGLQVATASYDSSYVSPEAKYAINVALAPEYTLTPSLGLRYVAGFFGGYTETGSSANLTVAGRTIQDIEERGELKLTRAMPVGPDLLLTSVYVGALGIERLGDTTVNTVLLGAGLPFVTPGRNNVAGVLGGGGLEWRTREGVSFFGAAEAIGFSDQSTVVSARGGVRVAF